MSSNRCSERSGRSSAGPSGPGPVPVPVAAAALVAVVVLAAVTAPAAAVEASSEDRPAEATVGSQVTATFTFTDLYTDYESWTLRGETNLTNVTWTVTTFDQAGNQLDQRSVDGQSFEAGVSLDEGIARVEVRLRGTVPEVESYSYDPRQTTTLGAFELVRDGGASETVETWTTHHYTEQSRTAREAIADAESAVSDGGAGSDDLEQAISAFEAGNFDNAVSNADSAAEAARNAQEQSRTTQLLLFGGIGVVALAAVLGGFVYWRNRQGPQDPLR